MKKLIAITVLVYVFCALFTVNTADAGVRKGDIVTTKTACPVYSNAGNHVYTIPYGIPVTLLAKDSRTMEVLILFCVPDYRLPKRQWPVYKGWVSPFNLNILK